MSSDREEAGGELELLSLARRLRLRARLGQPASLAVRELVSPGLTDTVRRPASLSRVRSQTLASSPLPLLLATCLATGLCLNTITAARLRSLCTN